MDRTSRVVTFRSGSSAIRSVYVDPAVTALDTLQPGEVVTVRYIEAVVVQLRPDATLGEPLRSPLNARPAPEERQGWQLTEVGTVEDVDLRTLQLAYRTSDFRRVVRPLADRRLLDAVRPGDRVLVTLTRDRAVGIERGRR